MSNQSSSSEEEPGCSYEPVNERSETPPCTPIPYTLQECLAEERADLIAALEELRKVAAERRDKFLEARARMRDAQQELRQVDDMVENCIDLLGRCERRLRSLAPSTPAPSTPASASAGDDDKDWHIDMQTPTKRYVFKARVVSEGEASASQQQAPSPGTSSSLEDHRAREDDWEGIEHSGIENHESTPRLGHTIEPRRMIFVPEAATSSSSDSDSDAASPSPRHHAANVLTVCADVHAQPQPSTSGATNNGNERTSKKRTWKTAFDYIRQVYNRIKRAKK